MAVDSARADGGGGASTAADGRRCALGRSLAPPRTRRRARASARRRGTGAVPRGASATRARRRRRPSSSRSASSACGAPGRSRPTPVEPKNCRAPSGEHRRHGAARRGAAASSRSSTRARRARRTARRRARAAGARAARAAAAAWNSVCVMPDAVSSASSAVAEATRGVRAGGGEVAVVHVPGRSAIGAPARRARARASSSASRAPWGSAPGTRSANGRVSASYGFVTTIELTTTSAAGAPSSLAPSFAAAVQARAQHAHCASPARRRRRRRRRRRLRLPRRRRPRARPAATSSARNGARNTACRGSRARRGRRGVGRPPQPLDQYTPGRDRRGSCAPAPGKSSIGRVSSLCGTSRPPSLRPKSWSSHVPKTRTPSRATSAASPSRRAARRRRRVAFDRPGATVSPAAACRASAGCPQPLSPPHPDVRRVANASQSGCGSEGFERPNAEPSSPRARARAARRAHTRWKRIGAERTTP